MNLELTLIVSQIIAFLIMLWVLRKFAWGPLLKILQERRNKIQAEFQELEAQREETKKLSESYQAKLNALEEETRRKIAEAAEQAKQVAQKIQEEAYTHARELLQKTRHEIQQEMQKAQAELKHQMVSLVIQATQKMIGEKLDQEKDEKMIADFVKELSK